MKKALFCLLFLLVGAPLAWGAGFQLFNEGSARVMSLGAAVTARTDLVEAAWYNPSAAAFFKAPEGMTGISVVVPSITFKSDQGQEYDMINRVHPLPYLYAICPLTERLAASFSFNLPYGLTTDWDSNWEGRYEAIYTSLKTYFMMPSVAYKLTDKLSLSAGVQIVYADAKMKKAATPLIPTIIMKLTGDDWSFGWQVSLTYKPWKHTTFGAIYRSQVDLDLDGDVTYKGVPSVASALFKDGNGRVSLTLPDTLQVGVATTVIPRWTLSFDLLWSGWSAYDKLHYNFQYYPGTGQPGTKDQPKNWRDELSLRLGAEYQVNSNWQLRLAYVYDPSPINDKTRGPELPTDDRQLFNVGVGYHKGHFRADASYTYLIMKDTHPGYETSSLEGTYEGDVHILGVDFAWRF